MHYLSYLAKEVDKTHPHLGNPVAVACLAVKAKKLLLLVSPRGCGKSRITSYVGYQHPQHSIQDRLSVAGLAYMGEEFTGFNGVVVVDDIAKTQTQYARIATVTTLAELCYSHYCHSRLQGAKFDITDFRGAALINIQPILLKGLVTSDEWEASMQDKSIRYYHLIRPLKPNPMPPQPKIDWGFDINQVEIPKVEGRLANKLKAIGETQWGLARLTEHTLDLLRAAAAFDRRNKVERSDYLLLIRLLQPLLIELLSTGKRELESGRYFVTDRLALLAEYFTYGSFTLKQLVSDYKLSESQCYRIMVKHQADWIPVTKNPTTFAPSEELRKLLKGVGIK